MALWQSAFCIYMVGVSLISMLVTGLIHTEGEGKASRALTFLALIGGSLGIFCAHRLLTNESREERTLDYIGILCALQVAYMAVILLF